jgi:hypothetical protein
VVSPRQAQFDNAAPEYLAALEDKGVFGSRRASVAKPSTTSVAPATLPVWVNVQATEYVRGSGGLAGVISSVMCTAPHFRSPSLDVF